MRNKSLLCGVLIIVAIVRPAAQEDLGRGTLHGLPGVRVYVEDVSIEAQRDGVTKDGIRTQAELLLRQAGIRVLTIDEWNSTPGLPMLRLSFTVAKNQLGIYGYNLEIEVLQRVHLARNTAVSSFSPTWMVPNVVGLSAASGLRNAARGDVQDKVEAFTNAYLAANPKP